VAGLHEATGPSSTPPSLIIVDRLESFLCSAGLHPGEQSCAAHLSALLCDTAAFFSQVLEQRAPCSAPCRILASFQKEMDTGPAGGEASAADPILNVLDRYFQTRCTLAQDSGYEAAAAGLQEVWHVYLSGTTDCEDVVQEWQLLISPDGLMEFKWI
uniref:SWIM-type zinc finger 7 associated protein 1 n=2 Tax=Mastacembelus armatus TaxID=205130 RepID=A0A7N8WZP4_9TELE